MANPNIQPGTLNRLRASVQIPGFPALNVTPSYLLPEGIDIAFQGEATTPIPGMVATINSPEPYQMVRVSIHLNKAQAFANSWKAQMETSTQIGAFTVRTDSPNIDPYEFQFGSILGVDRFAVSGRDAGFVLSLSGNYQLNAALWNG